LPDRPRRGRLTTRPAAARLRHPAISAAGLGGRPAWYSGRTALDDEPAGGLPAGGGHFEAGLGGEVCERGEVSHLSVGHGRYPVDAGS